MGLDWHLFQLTAYVDEEVFADESKVFTDELANDADSSPPLQQVANSLRQQLNMPKDSTLATVIEKAAVEFEVSPEATTLCAKAYECWKVLRDVRTDNNVSTLGQGLGFTMLPSGGVSEGSQTPTESRPSNGKAGGSTPQGGKSPGFKRFGKKR